MSDPWADPSAKRWKRHIEEEVAPAMERSGACISLAPPKDKIDAKFCVELGMSIMLNKPIIVVAETNDDVPPKLRQVADKIVIGKVGEGDFNQRLLKVMDEMGLGRKQ